MSRIKDNNQRKQVVSMSLSPTSLVILNNLAKVAKKSRSKVIEEMLTAKGFNDLGLSALEPHIGQVQNWRPKGKEDDAGACNPFHMDGRCKHDRCASLYRRWNV